jgi:hypothetical protein
LHANAAAAEAEPFWVSFINYPYAHGETAGLSSGDSPVSSTDIPKP